jgi:predicted PurR-regulated permease PerM
MGFLLYSLVAMISTQLIPIIAKMPEYYQELRQKAAPILQASPLLQKYASSIDLGKNIENAANTLFAGISLGMSSAAGLVFIFFLSLYTALSPDSYLDGFVSAFPHHMRATVRRNCQASAAAVRKWFYAQLTAMLIVGSLAAIALRIVGSPFYLLFGLITACLELLPYIGPIIALVTVSLITLASTPHAFPKTLIAFLLVLTVEGNVVIPVIMKGRVKLPPVYLLILMALMGEWFGIFGFLLASPTLAVLRTLYLNIYLPKVNKQIVAASELPDRQPESLNPNRNQSPDQAA